MQSTANVYLGFVSFEDEATPLEQEKKKKKKRKKDDGERLDSDFVRPDRRRRKRQVFQCGAAAITTTICRGNARLSRVLRFSENRDCPQAIHAQLDAT